MRDTIERILRQALGSSSSLESLSSVGGGCINNAMRLLLSDGRRFFLKTNRDHLVDMFQAEATGLSALAKTGVVNVPQPIASGCQDEISFLLLEWIEPGHPTGNSSAALGEMLARLHQDRGSDRFGFECDNYLGSTPQLNTWGSDWADFFIAQRLRPQFQSATEKGFTFAAVNTTFWERVREALSIELPPALLHGDLWGGNYMIDSQGKPYLIDPAPYWGHSEAEFGILTMFGGFDSTFFASYRDIIPDEPGSDYRLKIYQLYHYLNHLNLFGSSYLGSCQQIIQQI